MATTPTVPAVELPPQAQKFDSCDCHIFMMVKPYLADGTKRYISLATKEILQTDEFQYITSVTVQFPAPEAEGLEPLPIRILRERRAIMQAKYDTQAKILDDQIAKIRAGTTKPQTDVPLNEIKPGLLR